ncbi:M16 family metallopeptidase [Stieleria maiorica]|nr:M16 family metallopeptidase [Stieleria maiorica]
MLSIACILTVPARLAGEMPEPACEIEGISEYQLDNGLKVLFVPDSSIPTLTVNIIIRAGSRHEPYGQKGIAHLLEHMMFKGTVAFPDVRNVIRRNGWSMQASTWNDFTNYESTMPGTRENLEKIIHFEADRFANLRLTPSQLTEELKIVLNENSNAKASPENVLTEQMISVAFPWHNYGRATIGNQGDLSKMTVDSLEAFRRTYYRADNATIVLAGRFEPQLALDSIQTHFGGLKYPERVPPIESTIDPPQTGERRITVRGMTGKPVAALLYHGPAGAHEDFAAFEIFLSALMDTTPGYLWAQERFRSAALVSPDILGDGQLWGRISGLKQRGFVELYGTMPTDSAPEPLLNELVAATEHFAENVTREQVRSAKRRVLARMQSQLLDLRSFAVELRYWESLGNWRLYFLHRDRVKNVRVEDVQRVAKRYLHRDNRTEGLYFASSEPVLTTIQEPHVPPESFDGFHRESTISVGEWIEPDPLAVESRVSRRSFPNGVKVALLQKRTRGSMVHARLTFRLDSTVMPVVNAGALLLLPKLITSTNAKAAARLRVPGSVGLGTTFGSRTVDGLSITIRSEKEHFLLMLERLDHLLSGPCFTQDEFETLKRTNVASLERRSRLPYPLADEHLRRSGAKSLQEELDSLKSIRFADILDCYQQLTGSVHGDFVAVGDFEPETVIAKVAPPLDRWQSEREFQPPASYQVESESTELQIDGSPSACFAGDLYVQVGRDHPDYVALLVAHRVWMLRRLIPRISQDVGLSYYYSNSLQPLPGTNQSRVSLRATCDSVRLLELKRAIADSFYSLHSTEITVDELSLAKEHLANSARMKFWSDKSLLSSLAETTSEDRSFIDESNLMRRINEVGLADVQQAGKNYLNFDQMVIAVAGDVALTADPDQ